jgi:hypothetical protein
MARNSEPDRNQGIWVAWESHRRSRELAQELGLEIHELLFNGPYMIRALVLCWRTILLLRRNRPGVLVVQNPSMILAALAGLLRPLFGYFLVIDRHSNFKLHTTGSLSLKYKAFHALSGYSIRKADLTIVTNQVLCRLVDQQGGCGFVLPDKFPELPRAQVRSLGPGHHILYVCSFDEDEPVEAVLAAAELLREDFRFHVTGNFRKPGWKEIVSSAPANVRFMGFVAEDEYQSMLVSCQVVVTLTNLPHIMQCGAYEAVAAGTPLVFGPDQAMVEYFSRGCLSTELDPASIAQAIGAAAGDRTRLGAEIRNLRQERDADWQRMKADLLSRLPLLAGD